ncbi:hypothetical protein TWF281_009687 [Arthrobotrys megalospora]
MMNASPQMYREHSHQREHPPRDHPRDHHHPPHFPQPGPPPPPPYPNGPSLQSAQQQHHQLQQQLQQNGPPPPPGHHPGAPQTGPFPPQPLFSQPPQPPPQHPPPGQHHHQRSASYSDSHHQPQPQPQYHPSPHPPNRPASTTNRSMPPPSPPNYSRAAQGPPQHAQNFPPPSVGAPYGGGRDLPSISSLEIPREIPRPSNMSLSSILGDAPPGPPVRLESLTQSVYRDPARTLGPDLSPLKRPYTPGDRPIGGHAIEPSRSNSPPMNKPPPFPETRTPPYRPGPSISRPRDPHFSPPTRPLSQPAFPPQAETHPQSQPAPPVSQPHPHPPIYHHHQERIPEREPFPPQAPPHLRSQNHLRTSSYPDSPYQRQITEPPRREPTPPRSVQPPLPRHAQPNISPQMSQQPHPQPQPHPSPSYHHPAPPTSSAASLSFNAYTTQMPESPFAITPGLSNQHTISSLHQFDNDRKKPTAPDDPAQTLADRLHDTKPWERDHPERERSTDIPPLRAEEALVKGIHERKYPSSFANDQVSQSPKLKREVIVIDESDSVIKKDEDIEMGGVDLTMSPMKRADAIPVERAAKRRRGYYTAGSNLRSDSTLSNLEDAAAASLTGTPVKGGATFTSVNPSTSNNSLPAIPPPQIIDNSDVLAELKTHERHHLGSMVYTPTLLKKSGSVKSYSHIPLFMERENCTFIIRIPWYCLSLEERERVCKKRLLWGTEVYSDDSNILAVLIHLGYLPAVREGAEVVEYASAHDAVIARLSAPKRRGGAGRREIVAVAMAEGAPKTSASMQEKKDLLVKVVICGNLGEYKSVVRYGLKSRGWDGGHDGMGFMVEDVKWVDSTIGFGDVRGGKGVHERLKKWEAMRKSNDMVETLITTTKGKETEIKSVGSRWLVKEVPEKKREEEKEHVEMDVDLKEGEKPATVANGAMVS